MSDALAAIRKLYFGTSKATIERDFDEAIDLLKSMANEEERDRAAVFMDGLAQMKAEWGTPRPPQARRKAVRGGTKNEELRTKDGTKN
jgi:hypothetical protein